MLGSTVASQLPEQNAVNLAERYRAVCFVTLGVRPGLLSLLLSVLASDFFFVEAVLTFTSYSFLFAASYSVAALVSLYVKGKPVHR